MSRPLLLALLTLTAAWAAIPSEWTKGTTAAGTSAVLTRADPITITLDPPLADIVTGPTAVFYFAPLCPHCQHVAHEVAQLAAETKEELTWVGMATGNSEPTDIQSFATTYGMSFPMHRDASRGFSTAVQARSTPAVYILEPAESAFEGIAMANVIDSYTPFRPGGSSLVRTRLHPDDPFGHYQGYQGTAACAQCHTEEATSWALSLHSRAYSTIHRAERTEEQECVRCHVTGMGEGGFELGDHSSPHTNVGCEACHTASGPHDGQSNTATSTCIGCHDAKHSIAFTVEKGMPHIDHHQSNALSDSEIRKRLSDLQTGDVEKPLLAFPEGPTLGAGACTGCHQDSHKGWKKGDHAKAMRHLKGDDASDPACLRCHATPTAYPVVKEARAFRTAEGVGCETCHGAGAAHAKAPTTNNIVGLGESCPECVIESICTQCHTPSWDADWELKSHLEALKH